MAKAAKTFQLIVEEWAQYLFRNRAGEKRAMDELGMGADEDTEEEEFELEATQPMEE